MLRIANFEEIQGVLLRTSDLANQMARGDASFSQETRSWLETLEQVLIKNRLYVAGSVASLRAAILAAERGVIPAGVAFRGQPTRRQIRDATAADALRSANDLVANAIREDAARIAEAERLCRQIVVLASSKKLIPVIMGGLDHTAYLKTVWQAISADPDVAPGATRLEGLVWFYDVLVVLDRTMVGDLAKKPIGFARA
jgi:hypothetical protein